MAPTRLASVSFVVGLAAVLSGCSPSPTANSGGSTPTALTAEDAATAYSGTICTFNEGARAFSATWTDDAATLRQIKEGAALAQVEAESAKETLETTAWPIEVDSDVDVVVTYLDERITKLDQVIAAETLEELDPIELATTPDAVNESAARIEETLSLEEGYCSGTAAPAEEPGDGGEELVGTTWTGTDSDDDETTITFSAANAASVLVSDVPYEGTWTVTDGSIRIAVSTQGEALEYLGNYSPGVTALSLSGTASNGHTFDVLVTSF